MGYEAVAESNRRRTRHGLCHTPTYQAWLDMRQRCLNPNNARAADYYSRGIRVCRRWDRFENFLADMGVKPEGLSLGRIDNDGPYSPTNCRWETRKQQQRNRRGNHWIKRGSLSLTVTEWAERLGVAPTTIHGRLRRGWPLTKVLTYGSNRSTS